MATHITSEERRSIERALKKGKGVREIARMRKRSPSSISSEIRRGSKEGTYDATRAQKSATVRRKKAKQKCLKVAMDPQLKEYVLKKLQEDQTPEAISGRLRMCDRHLQYASPKAIYHFVYSVHGRVVEKHLYRKRVKRRGGPKRGVKRAGDHTKQMITERPKEVEKRREFGHFEGDFIVSGKGGSEALLVLVERMTRMPFLVRVPHRGTREVNALIERALYGIPVKSVTLDNDISFAKHQELSALIGAPVFFTRPYTSQDKGTVENRNGRVREFIPKRSDISQVSDEKIREAQEHLRTRYMKCLGWRTPQEVWDEEVRKESRCVRIQKNAQCAGGSLSK